jgi:hypothetical protein
MKKIVTTVLACLGLFSVAELQAQNIVTTTPQYRNVVLEEFTGIHCTYCPDGHKRAKQLAADYPGRVVLLNIHQGGYAVPSGNEPDFRTPWGDPLAAQTNLTGYPCGTVNRHVFPGHEQTAGGTAMGRGDWAQVAPEILSDVSPVNVGATTSYNSSTNELTITVEAYYTANASNSINFINVALAQDSVWGPQTGAPTYNPDDWINGQYNHSHMFREFLTGQWGDTITNTTAGSVFTKTYTLTVPADFYGIPFNINNCKVAVYVTETTQEVLTGIQLPVNAIDDGNHAPFYGSFTNVNNEVLDASFGNTVSFTMNFSSSLAGNNNYVVNLTKVAPAGWTANYSVGANTYTSQDTVTITGTNPVPVSVNVTPDNTPKIATYTLSFWPVGDPNNKVTQKMYVVSGVTDVVVDGSGAWGDGNFYDWTSLYTDGLAYASNTTYDSTSADVMVKAITSGQFSGVNNIYMNVGWTFPSFSDADANALMTFMDNGGNVMVCGQDIAWDIMSGSGYGTSVTQNLFTNYFHASFVNDGSSANNLINADTSDVIFGDLGSSSIIDAYNGNLYPDQINPVNGASSIFQYNNTSAKISGVRYTNGTYKLVYIGIGMEQVADAAVRKNIIKRAHDWFYGIVNSVNANNSIFSNVDIYPVPAQNVITVSNILNFKKLDVINILGETVLTQNVTSNTMQLNIDNLPAGTYLLKLSNGNTFVTSKFIKQ